MTKKLAATEGCLREADMQMETLRAELRRQDDVRRSLEEGAHDAARRERQLLSEISTLEATLRERDAATLALHTELEAHQTDALLHDQRLSSLSSAESKMARIQDELHRHNLDLMDADKRDNYNQREIAKLRQLAEDESKLSSLLKSDLARERVRVKELTENVQQAEQCLRRQISERGVRSADTAQLQTLCEGYQVQLDTAAAELTHRDRLASLESVQHNVVREGLQTLLQRLHSTLSPERLREGGEGGRGDEGEGEGEAPLSALVAEVTAQVRVLLLERRA